MKKISFIILIIIAFIGCNRSNKVPDYVIPSEDMINIIIDIHLTDGVLTLSNVRRKLAKEDSINYYDRVFETYGYTRKDFDTSIYYYSLNMSEYDRIYGEVLNRLNEMETKLKEEHVEEIKREQETSVDE